MASSTTASEVKGMYFAAARQHLLETDGVAALDRVARAMKPEYRDAMAEPEPSRWYPEAALRDAFHAVHSEVCGRDLARFRGMIEGSTNVGMQRFFRALIGITTPAFYLRNFPTVVSRLRRGPARVEVELEAGTKAALVRFVDMPYSDDTLYHAATVAGFDIVFAVMGHPGPRVVLRSATPSSYEMALTWE